MAGAGAKSLRAGVRSQMGALVWRVVHACAGRRLPDGRDHELSLLGLWLHVLLLARLIRPIMHQ